MTLLLLGGTGEARALAALLVARDVDVVSSLAGRVTRPRLPVGEVRIGGFGGSLGLRAWIDEHGVSAVVDATHPFSATISANAVAACGSDVPLLRLQRPGWEITDAHGVDAYWVDDHAGAAMETARLGERPFLTVGRQSLPHFVGPLEHASALVRVVDPPSIDLPATWRLVVGRGPYKLADELETMTAHRVDVLVTKDSGGDHTRPKLDAAVALGIPLVVVRRPAAPAGVSTVSDVEAAADWVVRR